MKLGCPPPQRRRRARAEETPAGGQDGECRASSAAVPTVVWRPVLCERGGPRAQQQSPAEPEPPPPHTHPSRSPLSSRGWPPRACRPVGQ